MDMHIAAALERTHALNVDRSCEACGRDWRGSHECPVCMWANVPEDAPDVEPFAIFVYDWPGIGSMYRIIGGARHRSDVTGATLAELGIPVVRS